MVGFYRRRKIFCCLLLVILAAVLVLAPGYRVHAQFQPYEYQQPEASDQGKQLWQTLGYLLYFLFSFALVIGLAFLSAKFLGRRMMPRGAGKVLRVLEILPLGLNKSVYIVAIGSKVVALGVAEKSINLLLELDEATSRKMLEAVDVFPPVGKTGSTFSIAAWLRKLFPANPNASSPPEKELNSFRDSFQKYMERLSYLQKDAYVDDGAKNPEVSKEGKKNNGQKNGD